VLTKRGDMQPNIETRKVEKKVKHDFGPTWRQIGKLADELGGISKVIDYSPELWVRYLQELLHTKDYGKAHTHNCCSDRCCL